MIEYEKPQELEEIEALINLYELNRDKAQTGKCDMGANGTEFVYFIDGYKVTLTAKIQHAGQEGVAWLAKRYGK